MTLIQSIILGIIQGLTEFLPISSSAHLVLTPYILDWKVPPQQAFIFDIIVQLGTLLAVIVYFRKDLFAIIVAVFVGLKNKQPFLEPSSRLGWILVLATIPAVIAGVLFKNVVERAFDSPVAVAFFLYGTTILLVTAELVGKRIRNLDSVTWKDALVIGLFQVISLLPGISRSGSTISGGMIRNLERPVAARFSFLMSIPVMLGAGLIAVLDLINMSGFTGQIPTLIAGFISSAIVGYFSIRWLLAFLTKRRLYPFAIYCAIVSTLILIFSLFKS